MYESTSRVWKLGACMKLIYTNNKLEHKELWSTQQHAQQCTTAGFEGWNKS